MDMTAPGAKPSKQDPVDWQATKHITDRAIDIAEQRDDWKAKFDAAQARSQGLEEALREAHELFLWIAAEYPRVLLVAPSGLWERVRTKVNASLSLGLPDEEGEGHDNG
jgi:hypothetical protein